MKKLLVFVCAVTFLLLSLNVQAAPLAGEYEIAVSATQLGPYSWNFEYQITNINQEAPGDIYTGLDGFQIEKPGTAVISNVVVPVPYYGDPGWWFFGTQGGGLAFYWGQMPESVYPSGQTATFSFQADGVVVGNRDATISTYWGDFNAPGSVQFENGFWYSSFDTTLVGPAPTPTDTILIFFDESVADGTLTGDGPGDSANGRLNALRSMLEMAGDLIAIGDIEGACGQLKAALGKCDGESPPPDFVAGPAASELKAMIIDLMSANIILTQLTNHPESDGSPSWSPNNSKIAFSSLRSGSGSIWVMNTDGTNKIQLTENLGDDVQPHWSSDGTKIVFPSTMSGNWDIWIMDSDGSNLVQLTDDPEIDYIADFSPDGSNIIFRSDRSGNSDIWIMESNGSNPTQITDSPENQKSPNFSPDGSKIVYRSDENGNYDIWIMDSDGFNAVQLTDTPENEGHPHISPDGSKIIFWSERTNNREVWIMNLNGSGQNQITNNPANDGGANWSPDGGNIVFRSDRTGNNDIWKLKFIEQCR